MKSRHAAELPNRSFQDPQYWDEFFKNRNGQPFEWYAEWEDLSGLLARHCAVGKDAVILVPGCGNSGISAALYDEGFTNITNIDLCRDVIAQMMRLNLRQRPRMFWKVMDMTKMQFPDHSFDLVLDKGGIDALLGEPEEDPSPGLQFLSEVRRVLKLGGKYACVTLAQDHVTGVLLSSFRHGWKVDIYQMKPTGTSKTVPFFVVATKQTTTELPLISPVVFGSINSQVHSLQKVVEHENHLRSSADLEADLDMSSFTTLRPGQRITLTLGGNGGLKTTFKTVILDAKDGYDVLYPCGVFLVPKSKAHEWLYSSEEGQWQVVESAKAGRLIMVFVETNIQPGNNADLQDDLSPLVRGFVPACSGSPAPFLMPDDGVFKGKLLEEVDSPLTGTMLVEDVVSDKNKASFRRLFFKRNPNLIQSEALLTVPKNDVGNRRVGSKKKSKAGKESPKKHNSEELVVDHGYLASPYHEGMVAGLSLIAADLEAWITSKSQVRAMVVGLGAGLLPMFLYKHLPIDIIQVVELDGVVGDLARRHFGFIEDERMQLQVGDGIAAVESVATGSKEKHLHILIVDADSADPSDGLSCPPGEFLEKSFLESAKAALVEHGVLIINLVSRAREPHLQAIARLSEIFTEVHTLQIDQDVNFVIFALAGRSSLFGEGATALQNAYAVLKKVSGARLENKPALKESLKRIKRVK